MAPLVVLLAGFLAARVAGRLGVEKLSAPQAAGRAATLAMFLFTGATHFSPMKHDYVAMTPKALPRGVGFIYLAGALQLAGAAGLAFDRTRRLAGICLALLLVAMYPANVNAAVNGISFRGRPPTPLWLRTPVQIVYVLAVWWSAIKEDAETTASSRGRRWGPR
jgi:uncharacterized membrane protein